MMCTSRQRLDRDLFPLFPTVSRLFPAIFGRRSGAVVLNYVDEKFVGCCNCFCGGSVPVYSYLSWFVPFPFGIVVRVVIKVLKFEVSYF